MKTWRQLILEESPMSWIERKGTGRASWTPSVTDLTDIPEEAIRNNFKLPSI